MKIEKKLSQEKFISWTESQGAENLENHENQRTLGVRTLTQGNNATSRVFSTKTQDFTPMVL